MTTRWRGTRVLMPSPAVRLSVAAVVAATLMGLALVVAIGVPVSDAVSAFINGAWGSAYSVAASINRSLEFLTNVGGEGQIAIGGIVATAVSLYGGVATLPYGLPFLLPMLGAALGGGLWAALAGWLKARAGTNEVISTLLLSFIGVWLLYWSVQSEALLRQPMTNSATLPESLEIPASTKLPLLTGNYAMPLNVGLPVTVVLVVLVALVLTKTTLGVRLRAVGLNPVAARRAGIPVQRSIIMALAVAGALGGLAGSLMLQGDQYVLKAGFSSGYGFDGLVVGLLARGSVVGVVAGALLFGFMRSGGINMEMSASVPSALVAIIQGLIIVTLAGAAFWIERKERGR
ncbi:MAG: ABC transporter permease [Gammaproteobacteria bacterium]